MATPLSTFTRMAALQDNNNMQRDAQARRNIDKLDSLQALAPTSKTPSGDTSAEISTSESSRLHSGKAKSGLGESTAETSLVGAAGSISTDRSNGHQSPPAKGHNSP